MKKFLDYLFYSNLEVTVSLNPFRWGFAYLDVERASEYDPGLLIRIIGRLGPLKVHFWIDDGSW